jgi:chromosome segregation ATPase
MLESGIPGELRDKLKLETTLNKILRETGYLDLAQMEATVTTLKTQLNYLLSEVVGIEHNIDDLHAYDDSNLKTQLSALSSAIETYNENVTEIQDRTEALELRTGDISHPDNATLISNPIPAVISTSPTLSPVSGALLKLIPVSLTLGVLSSIYRTKATPGFFL